MFDSLDAQEDARPVWYVNRMLVVLRPNPPFLEWVNSLAAPGETLHDLDTLRSQANAYLIPLFEYLDEAAAWVHEHFDLIFETELWQWSEDGALWPEDRTLAMFGAWFEPEILRAPWDVVTGPITSEPPPPDREWH